MKSFTALAVASLFAIGFLALAFYPLVPIAAQAPEAEPAQSWEYKHYVGNQRYEPSESDLKALNSLGAEEWELVQMVQSGDFHGPVYLFKRPKQIR
jgi:hypothetical protein